MIFRDSYQPHVLRRVGCLALDCPHSAQTVRNLWAPFLKRGQYPLQKVTYWKKTYGCLYKSLVASHSFLKARSKDHVTYATLNISLNLRTTHKEKLFPWFWTFMAHCHFGSGTQWECTWCVHTWPMRMWGSEVHSKTPKSTWVWTHWHSVFKGYKP